MTVNPPHRRHPELDLLRFLASISVVFYHYTFRGWAGGHYSPLPFPGIGQVSRYGYLGVQLFFMISGYVILASVQQKSLKQFFVSRARRLYPVFWIACTLTFLVKILLVNHFSSPSIPAVLRAHSADYLYNLTMLYSYLGVPAVDGSYWSLQVEIAFYFLMSLLLSYNLIRYIDWFIVLLLCICLLPGLPQAGTFVSTLFFPDFAPYITAGMLFFLLQQQKAHRLPRFILLVISFFLCLRSARAEMLELIAYYGQPFSFAVVAAVILLFFCCFAFITTNAVHIKKHKGWLLLGNLTYPLYLIHADIGFILFNHLADHVDKYVLLFGTVGLMMMVAYAIQQAGEKLMPRLFNRLLRYGENLGLTASVRKFFGRHTAR